RRGSTRMGRNGFERSCVDRRVAESLHGEHRWCGPVSSPLLGPHRRQKNGQSLVVPALSGLERSVHWARGGHTRRFCRPCSQRSDRRDAHVGGACVR
ncbi:hypothetical protein AAVH_14806, partial [Aphelenchoides avenae]